MQRSPREEHLGDELRRTTCDRRNEISESESDRDGLGNSQNKLSPDPREDRTTNRDAGMPSKRRRRRRRRRRRSNRRLRRWRAYLERFAGAVERVERLRATSSVQCVLLSWCVWVSFSEDPFLRSKSGRRWWGSKWA